MGAIFAWQDVVCQRFRARIKIVATNKDVKYKRKRLPWNCSNKSIKKSQC